MPEFFFKKNPVQTVCFTYLWSLDNNAILTSLKLFRSMCEEAEIRFGLDDLPAEYSMHGNLAAATNLQTAGRTRSFMQAGYNHKTNQVAPPSKKASAPTYVAVNSQVLAANRPGTTPYTIGICSRNTFNHTISGNLSVLTRPLSRQQPPPPTTARPLYTRSSVCWPILVEIHSRTIMSMRMWWPFGRT